MIDLLQRGVRTTVMRNGALLNSTRVNAFDERIEEGDALGNVTTHSFDIWGRRTASTFPETTSWATCDATSVRERASERVTYSDNDEVLSIVNPLGKSVTKRYDPHGRVTEIIGPDGVTQETRIYDDAYEPITLPTGPCRPSSIAAAPSSRQHLLRPRSVQTLDAMGNKYTIWLDALDRVYRQQAPDGTETSTSYDDRGRESRRVSPTGEIVTMSYDWADRPVQLTLDSGASTAIETRTYDVRGNLLLAVDADGEVRQRSYDVMNRLLSETLGDPARRTPLSIAQNVYDEHGRLAESVVNGVRTAFRYDDAGRLTRKLAGYDPAARATALMTQTLTYTARDEVDSTVDKRGEGVRSFFDERGRVIARETLFGGSVIGRTETGYDRLGRVVRAVNEEGNVACHTYDDYSRLASTTPPGLGARVYEYTLDAPHPVTGEPTHSLRTRVTAPTGETQDSYVDAMGRAWLSGNSASGYEQTTFESGRKTLGERIGTDGVTAAVKRFEYSDRSHRVAREWDWADAAELTACTNGGITCNVGSVSFAYTAGGRKLSQTDAAGNATVVSYAKDGTMLSSGLDAAGVTELRFEYDPAYPVMTARERGPKTDPIRTEYLLDRYLHHVRTDIQRPKTGDTERVDYTYDASGHRLSALLQRDGRQESRLAWTYDEYGRTRTKAYEFEGSAFGRTHHRMGIHTDRPAVLHQVSLRNQATYRYDANGLLQKIQSGVGAGAKLIAAFDEPDATGRYLAVDIANQLRITHSYESGRESSRSIESTQGTHEETYVYDALGRLQSSKRNTPSGDTQTLALGYDARNLLTSEAVISGDDSQSYTYAHDQLGRRVAKQTNPSAGDVLQTYAYDRGNRLLSVTGDSSVVTTWDAFGRPVNDHRNLRFTWGLSDQLRAIQTPDGNREEMLFDADGQRIARTVDGKTDRFFSSDLSGEVYSHERSDGSYLDVVRDPSGGVIALLSSDGNVIPWSAGKADTTLNVGTRRATVQSSFGENDSDAQSVELGFHQMWSSALTPLRFAGVRVYDDETGLFLTPDPLGVRAASDPNDAVDLFRYAHNNPIEVTDSTGYLGISPPTPTTIIVDGMQVETYDVNAWSVGTIRVANQAAYIAGVRAGIKYGLGKGWSSTRPFTTRSARASQKPNRQMGLPAEGKEQRTARTDRAGPAAGLRESIQQVSGGSVDSAG